MSHKNPVVTYIANGQLKEAIEATIHASEKIGTHSLIEQSLLLAGRFNRIQESKRSHSLEDEYIRLEENKIRDSILDLASKFPDQNVFNTQPPKKKSNIFLSFISRLISSFKNLFT